MWDSKVYKELESELEKENRIKGNNTHKNILYGIIIFIIFLPQILLFLTRKTYEFVPDLDNLSEPIQTPATGGTTMRTHGTDVQIEFLAKYDIKGKIISAKDYAGTDIEKGISPRDFAIGRGKMSRQEIIDKFNRNDYRNRFIYVYVPRENETRFNAEFSGDVRNGNRGTLRTQFSNNHLIPANKKVRRLLKKIKEGDVVRLQGYLVYVRFETKQGLWEWHSSLSRDDRGNHSCEVIYVTNVTRLKEDN